MNVAVIGIGAVGETVCHALVQSDTVGHLILANGRVELAHAVARDLRQSRAWGRRLTTEVLQLSDLDEVGDCDLVLLTLGPRLRAGEKRPQKLLASVAMYCDTGVLASLTRLALTERPPIVLVVTNPVEPLVTWLCATTAYPSARIMGLGCTVESARLACHEASRLKIAPMDVGLHVVGEHGEHIDAVSLGGSDAPFGAPKQLAHVRNDASIIRRLSEQVGRAKSARLVSSLEAAHPSTPSEVLTWLGHELDIAFTPAATRFAIAACVLTVARAIRNDEHRVLSVSAVAPDDLGVPPVALALPWVVGRAGVLGCRLPAVLPEAVHKAAAAIEAALCDAGLRK